MPKQSKAGKTSYEGMIENPGISVYPLLLRPPDQRSLPGQSPQRNPLGKRPETRNNLIARPCDSYRQASIPCPRQADDQVGDVRLLSLGRRGVGDDRLEVRSMRCDDLKLDLGRIRRQQCTSPMNLDLGTGMEVPDQLHGAVGLDLVLELRITLRKPQDQVSYLVVLDDCGRCR